MATLRLPHRITARTPAATGPEAADAACPWDEELRVAGIEPTPSWVFTFGVPVLALVMLVATAVTAEADAGNGRGLTLPALGLLLLAAAPWLGWLVLGDRGPTWPFALAALAPVTLLGFGHWFIVGIGPSSSLAFLLLAFPGLLLVILGVIFATPKLAAGMAIGAYAAFAGPLFAALIDGRDVSGALIVTWHMGFALTAVAAYTVRLSNQTNRALAEAQAALARQAMAEDRRRVARDVHDVVAHTLAVTMLHITAARMAVRRGDPDEAEAALEEAERQGRASLADIRRIVRLLRTNDASALDAAQPGLDDIDTLVEGYRTAGLPIEMTTTLSGHRASTVAELALYRVLQEALTNAVRHGSGPVKVTLAATADGLNLTASNPLLRTSSTRGSGSGLTGMRERIAAAGGQLDAGARDGHWIVRATVPIEGTA